MSEGLRVGVYMLAFNVSAALVATIIAELGSTLDTTWLVANAALALALIAGMRPKRKGRR